MVETTHDLQLPLITPDFRLRLSDNNFDSPKPKNPPKSRKEIAELP